MEAKQRNKRAPATTANANTTCSIDEHTDYNQNHTTNMHTCCHQRRIALVSGLSSSTIVISPLVLLLSLLSITTNCSSALQSSIKFENSGYTGITLTFSNQLNVKDFAKEDLIENVQVGLSSLIRSHDQSTIYRSV